MTDHDRHCMRCGRTITACNGFVLARDWLAASEGRIPWTSVREHCGWCAERLALSDLRALQ